MAGPDRACKGPTTHTIALMCAERHPLDCHRGLLVGRRPAERGVAVGHILADGRIEPHDETEGRLLALAGLDHADIFESETDRLARAYRRHGRKVAFAEETAGVEPSR